MDRKERRTPTSYCEDLAVTARRYPERVADSLASQTALLSELMDCVDELVLILDPALMIVKSNRYASIFLGYSERELVGRPLREFIAEGERKRFEETAEAATKMRRAGEGDFVTRARSVVRLAFSLSPLRGAEGEGHGFLAVARRVESGASGGYDSSGLFERMLRGFSDPLFLVEGCTRTIIDCNDAAVSAFGLAHDELVGRRLFEFGPQAGVDSGDAIMARADEAYATKGIFQERLRLPRKDGSSLACDCIAVPVFNRGGSMASTIVMLFDRSIEEEREAELGNLIRRVSELGAQLGSLASSYPRREEAISLSALGFSPRQVEIARLVAEGASSKAIGFKLGIAESTVKNHLAALYRKLEVGSRMGFMHEVAERRIKLR